MTSREPQDSQRTPPLQAAMLVLAAAVVAALVVLALLQLFSRLA